MPLLASLEPYERAAVADAFEEQSYAAGEVVLAEGGRGENFFLLVRLMRSHRSTTGHSPYADWAPPAVTDTCR